MTVIDRRWRAVLTLVLAIYGYFCLRSPGDYRWIDSLDLAIHETGHLLFAFDGETLMVMGGTLFQTTPLRLFSRKISPRAAWDRTRTAPAAQ